MASVWITTRTTTKGEKRHRVEFCIGGRESATRYGGSFRTRREALARKAWIHGELAAMRVPDLRALAPTMVAPTFAQAAERWLASRLDVAEGTRIQQRTSINRASKVLGSRRIDEISAQDVAAMVAAVVESGAKPSYVRSCAYRATCARRSRRPRRSTCSRFIACCRRGIGCRCSCSTRPG